MNGRLPELMRAATQESPGGPLIIRNMPVPVPGVGEVLVRMAACPINPSDLSMLQGTYATRPVYPIIPGIEGSGIVVAAGKGFLPRLRNGKRVACSSSTGKGGTWSEYMVTSAKHAIPIGEIPYINGSMAIVNPLTALAFINIARMEKHRAAVNNAAASALGKMLIRLFKRYKIPLVNIVRSDYQAETLSKIGADYILNSSEPGFAEKIADLSEKLGATLFFDAVGGEQTNILINGSPPGSKVIIYANLSESDFVTQPRVLIQKGKKIEGFFLGNYTSDRSILLTLGDISKVKRMIKGDLSSTVSETYTLDAINDALADYRSMMSKGKIVITPNPGMLE